VWKVSAGSDTDNILALSTQAFRQALKAHLRCQVTSSNSNALSERLPQQLEDARDVNPSGFMSLTSFEICKFPTAAASAVGLAQTPFGAFTEAAAAADAVLTSITSALARSALTIAVAKRHASSALRRASPKRYFVTIEARALDCTLRLRERDTKTTHAANPVRLLS
jgi:hypothetical protein